MICVRFGCFSVTNRLWYSFWSLTFISEIHSCSIELSSKSGSTFNLFNKLGPCYYKLITASSTRGSPLDGRSAGLSWPDNVSIGLLVGTFWFHTILYELFPLLVGTQDPVKCYFRVGVADWLSLCQLQFQTARNTRHQLCKQQCRQ